MQTKNMLQSLNNRAAPSFHCCMMVMSSSQTSLLELRLHRAAGFKRIIGLFAYSSSIEQTQVLQWYEFGKQRKVYFCLKEPSVGEKQKCFKRRKGQKKTCREFGRKVRLNGSWQRGGGEGMANWRIGLHSRVLFHFLQLPGKNIGESGKEECWVRNGFRMGTEEETKSRKTMRVKQHTWSAQQTKT